MIKRTLTALSSALLIFSTPSGRPLEGADSGATLAREIRKYRPAQPIAGNKKFEELFLSIPTAASAREHLRYYTKAPHLAGSKEDYETAIHTRDRLASYGIEAKLVEYHVLLPYPRERIVEIVSPVSARFRADLGEQPIAEDTTSGDPHIVPVYNGYSASGEVTADLVYVNYGLPDDFERLKKMGVDLKGKIAIARYGEIFRGLKAMTAQENGMAGLIIYSDPADDGYMQGDVYPQGPWRPASGAQRGSVQFLSIYPGDPQTPGWASTAQAKRLPLEEVTNIPRIPVQPISYRDATPLLRALGGKNVPHAWQGGLPFAYHTGPGPVRVHLKTDMDFQVRTIWNVIARIAGAEEPNRAIILGNHRDAWVFGAVDPGSGSATLLEVARSFGELLKGGWRPRRSLLFCSWDAEEFGLIGSTEWVEENAQNLDQQAVVYLNVDSAVSGPRPEVSGVPSYAEFVRSILGEIKNPRGGGSLLDAWIARQREAGSTESKVSDFRGRLGRLGSGSDYTPFLQHLGIASLNMGFGGDYGVYHSAYDSFTWMEKFGDPDFALHRTAAQWWGLTALRLADAELLPQDYTEYANALSVYLGELERLLGDNRSRVDIGSLSKAIEYFQAAATIMKTETEDLARKVNGDRRAQILNDRLMQAERAFIMKDGLPRRPWYRHTIYAPGLYAGYGSEVLPGVMQPVRDADWGLARSQLEVLVTTIRRSADTLLGK